MARKAPIPPAGSASGRAARDRSGTAPKPSLAICSFGRIATARGGVRPVGAPRRERVPLRNSRTLSALLGLFGRSAPSFRREVSWLSCGRDKSLLVGADVCEKSGPTAPGLPSDRFESTATCCPAPVPIESPSRRPDRRALARARAARVSSASGPCISWSSISDGCETRAVRRHIRRISVAFANSLTSSRSEQ
jgi:hypothetical protein